MWNYHSFVEEDEPPLIRTHTLFFSYSRIAMGMGMQQVTVMHC